MDTIISDYDINLKTITVGNQFIYKEYDVSDPYKNGLDFKVCINDQHEITDIQLGGFKMARFNMAEGYTQKDFESLVKSILKGEVSETKSLKFTRPKVQIKTSQGVYMFTKKSYQLSSIKAYKTRFSNSNDEKLVSLRAKL